MIAEQSGDADQDLVTGGVSEAVVDGLEVIDVEDREADRTGRSLLGEPLELARQVAAIVGAPGMDVDTVRARSRA